jgi:SAM-dependent methyltransferase
MNTTIHTFDTYAGDYDHWFDTHPECYQEQLAVLRSILPYTGRGLETGAGSGRFAAPLGIQRGLDPSVPLLSLTYSRGVEPVLGIGESLPYHTDTFDFVLMMTVICFMDDIVQSFREAYRVIRPGGTLVIGFIKKSGEIARQERTINGRFLRHARFRSTDEVREALNLAGFIRCTVRKNLHGFCMVTAQKE